MMVTSVLVSAIMIDPSVARRSIDMPDKLDSTLPRSHDEILRKKGIDRTTTKALAKPGKLKSTGMTGPNEDWHGRNHQSRPFRWRSTYYVPYRSS